MKTWQRQLKDFGHTEADKYTSLTFDNRGMGESGKPLLRYTTSEMAKDLVELLDHVGWTGKRSVHVVGISMGGMIAQELVCLNLNCKRCGYPPNTVVVRACSSPNAYAASTSSPPRLASSAQSPSSKTSATELT